MSGWPRDGWLSHAVAPGPVIRSPHAPRGRDDALSWFQIIVLSAVQGPLVLAASPALSFMPTFYAQTIGFPLEVVGLITVCGRIFDIGSDATIGFLADYTESRHGRRKIWIVLSTVPLLGAMWWLYEPSPHITPVGALVALALFFVAWTAVTIPYQAHTAEVTRDYVTRSRVVLAQGIFLAGAGIASIGIPFLVLDPRAAALRAPLIPWLEQSHWTGAASLLALFAAGARTGQLQFGPLLEIVAFVTTVTLTVVLLLYLIVIPDRSTGTHATSPAAALRLLRLNGPLHRLLVGHLLIEAGVFWFVGLMPFYLAYVQKAGDLVLLGSLLMQSVGVLMTPLWSRLLGRFGRAGAFATAAGTYALGLLALWFTPPGHETVLLGAFLWLGIAFIPLVMVPYSLGADAADYLHWRTGKECAAIHMSMISLTTKIGVAMSAVALIAVSAAGFDPARGATTGVAIERLRFLTTLGPAALCVAGGLIVLTFPVTAERHRAIRRRLRRRAETGS